MHGAEEYVAERLIKLAGKKRKAKSGFTRIETASNKGIRGGSQGRDLGRWSVAPYSTVLYIVSRSGKVASIRAGQHREGDLSQRRSQTQSHAATRG